jgi:protein phosphatase
MVRLDSSVAGQLVDAVHDTNQRILDAATQTPGRSGMGTTVCGFAVGTGRSGPFAAVVNVGDSRVYLLRDGTLTQLTTDHSLAAQLLAAGTIDEQQAAHHPRRHVLTRAVGVEPDVDVDLSIVSLLDDDRLLVCSDGLSSVIDLEHLAALLQPSSSPDECVESLIGRTLAEGAPDNVSVIVVDVVAAG